MNSIGWFWAGAIPCDGSGGRGCGALPTHCTCNRDRIRTITMVTHARTVPPAAVVRVQSSSSWVLTCIPRGQRNEHTAYQAERSAHRLAGAALLLQSGARTRTRTYRRNTMGSRPFLRAHSSLVSVISLCPLEVARKRRIRVLRPTSMRSRDVRGRMRRPGASCTTAKTHALSKHVLSQECRKIRAGRWRRLRNFRHSSQYSRRRGWWLELALGYRHPRLLTCGIQSQHAVCAH